MEAVDGKYIFFRKLALGAPSCARDTIVLGL